MNALHPAMVSPFTLATLAASPLWVAWQEEERQPGKPATKVPYSPSGGKARADDPLTWGPRAKPTPGSAPCRSPWAGAVLGWNSATWAMAGSWAGLIWTPAALRIAR